MGTYCELGSIGGTLRRAQLFFISIQLPVSFYA